MTVSFKHIIQATNIDEAIEKVANKLKSANFGILTKIDFAAKLQEKLNVNISNTVILGACNPSLAYEIYQIDADFLSLIPCNIVIREITDNKFSIEMIKPSQMVKPLENNKINAKVQSMDDVMLQLLLEIQ